MPNAAVLWFVFQQELCMRMNAILSDGVLHAFEFN